MFELEKLMKMYREEATFNDVVSFLLNVVETNGITPLELRQALFLAHYLYDMKNPTPMPIVKDVETWKKIYGTRSKEV